MDETPGPVEDALTGPADVPARVEAARMWLDKHLRRSPETARELIGRLLPEAEAEGLVAETAWLRFHQGWLTIDADDYESARTVLETAKTGFETLKDHEGLARVHNALGFLYFAIGIHDLALEHFRGSMWEAEQAERPDLAGPACTNMAECLCAIGATEEARAAIEHCRRSLHMAPYNVAVNLLQMGMVFRSLGRYGEAESTLLEAIQAAGGVTHEVLEAEQVMAEVQADSGRLDEAEALAAAGIEACSAAGLRLIGTRFRLTRARLFALRGLHREAIACLDAAIATAREIGARRLEGEGEKALFQAWQACGDCRKALEAFLRYSAIKDALQSQQTSRHISALNDERTRLAARHFENLYRQASAIGEIGRQITASLDLDATLETMYGAINSIMDAPTLAIAVVDEAEGCLDYRLVMTQGERREPFRISLEADSFGCWCVRNREDILIGDIDAEHGRYLSSAPGMVYGDTEKSLVFVPLMIGDKVSGMLTVQSTQRNAYDKRTVETVRAIGSYIAIAIENSRLFRMSQESEKSLRREHTALLKAQAELKQLRGILPICSSCKKIRQDDGSWRQLESYIRDNSEAEFTHGICPECARRIYGDVLDRKKPGPKG